METQENRINNLAQRTQNSASHLAMSKLIIVNSCRES